MSYHAHAKTALEELQAIDRDTLPAELTETYDRALEDIETLCTDFDTATEPDNQPTKQPDTPEEWDEDEWDDKLDAARDKAPIPPTKGSLTTKTINGRDYYYLQWRDGDTVTSQYVGPVEPA